MSKDAIEARLDRVEHILGHRFVDRDLLRAAITHPSAVDEPCESSDYERLEFLGDSIVGLFVAEEIYRRFPRLAEGGMTRIKVSVVAGTVLARVSEELGLADVIVLGESELGTGKRGLASALENLYEALTAALYLDAGRDVARDWVLATLGPLLHEELADTPESPKSELQEVVQATGSTPEYEIVSQQGPPHDRTFVAAVSVDGRVIGEGSGRTKKEAEAGAARQGLKRLRHSG